MVKLGPFYKFLISLFSKNLCAIIPAIKGGFSNGFYG